MNLATALRLARISNVPTVWTNVLVGALLAGGTLSDARLPLMMLAMSLFYIGGMFLNDAFDRGFDARHRPDRPIPSGQVSARVVFSSGFGMLGLGTVGVALASRSVNGMISWHALAAACALAGMILLYDAYHKGNPLSPFVMGLCRVLVYVTAAVAVAPMQPSSVVLLAALALLCHLVGLTYLAKQEHLDRISSWWPLGFLVVPVIYGAALASVTAFTWLPLSLHMGVVVAALSFLRRRAKGDVPRAVVLLIAGISTLDAVVLAGHGFAVAASLALGAFVLTLGLQKWVPGT